jgi:hypothetical protein
MSGPTYDPAKLDPTTVAYEPIGFEGGALTPPYYYLAADPSKRVVWVQPTSETGVNPATGWFALYTGDEASYAPVVPEAA